MAINLGDAFIRVRPKLLSDEFTKKLKGVNDGLRRFGKTASLIGGGITAAFAGIVKNVANAGDEISKLSDRTGFSAETLSEWKHALELSDATLSDLQNGVKRMSSVLLDAEQGLKTAKDSLAELGFTVEDFKGLSPEQAFEKFATAIADIEDPLRRSAIAQEIFGRSADRMGALLAAGSDGIAQMREEARRLGIVWSQETADAGAEFNDALLRLKESTGVMVREIGIALMPSIKQAVEVLTQLAIRFRAFAEEHPVLAKNIVTVTAAIGGLLAVVGPVALAISGVITAVSGLSAAFTGIVAVAGTVAAALASPWVAIPAAIALVTVAVVKHWDKLKEFAAWIRDTLKTAIDSAILSMQQLLGIAENLPADVGFGATGRADASSPDSERIRRLAAQASAAIKRNADAATGVLKEQKNLAEKQSAGLENQIQQSKQIGKAQTTAYQSVVEAANKSINLAQTMQSQAQTTAQSITATQAATQSSVAASSTAVQQTLLQSQTNSNVVLDLARQGTDAIKKNMGLFGNFIDQAFNVFVAIQQRAALLDQLVRGGPGGEVGSRFGRTGKTTTFTRTLQGAQQVVPVRDANGNLIFVTVPKGGSSGSPNDLSPNKTPIVINVAQANFAPINQALQFAAQYSRMGAV